MWSPTRYPATILILSSMLFSPISQASSPFDSFELNPEEQEQAQSYANITPSLTLGPEDAWIEIANPSPEEIQEILEETFNSSSDRQEIMRSFIVGIPGQNRLMTLADACRDHLISETAAGLILRKVQSFREGETATIKLRFGVRGMEEIIIGRFPRSMSVRINGQQVIYPQDPSLAPLVKWLALVMHLTWVNPLSAGKGPELQTTQGGSFTNNLNHLVSNFLYNWYQQSEPRNLNIGTNLSLVLAGITAGISSATASHSLWYSMMSGWGSLGYAGSYHLEENQLGLSALGVGGFLGGWKDFVNIGASLSVVAENGNQVGIGGVLSLFKDRVTTYLHPYKGQYDQLIDSIIAEYKKLGRNLLDEITLTQRLISLHQRINKEEDYQERILREKRELEKEYAKLLGIIWHFKREKDYLADKHFVQVVDSQSTAFRLQGGVFAAGVGVGVRAGLSKGNESIHRFYAPLARAQELLKDGNGDRYALMRLPEKFDTEQFPDPLKPQLWQIGEEVITTVHSTYNGCIVMGVMGIPGMDAKVGLSNTVSGSFEIGIRKLPGNKLEVTFCPTKIKELGGFISAISTLAELSAAASVALAMRQTFIFDLENPQAIDTYLLFMTSGVLPLDFAALSKRIGPAEAENLLDLGMIAKENLRKKGILLTYLEKIDVPAKKFHVSLARIPVLNPNSWAGLSYESLKATAKVVSTNADIAVSRITTQVETTKGFGRSGNRSFGAYATLKRVINKPSHGERPSDEYLWKFAGLTLQVRIDIEKVVGHEHNALVDKINRWFRCNLSHFPLQSEGHRQSRQIILERNLQGSDLDQLNVVKQSQIDMAALASGIERRELENLLVRLEDRGHYDMALLLKEFVSQWGVKGVAAIHLLLEGNCRNVIIRTDSSSYTEPLKRALALEATYGNPGANPGAKRLITLDGSSSSGTIARFFGEALKTIAALDQALRDLYEDPFYVGQDDLLKFADNKLRESKANLQSKLIAAKNCLLTLINLEQQELPITDIVTMYQAIDKDKRTVDQTYLLLRARYPLPISMQERRHEIAKRWEKTSRLSQQIITEKSALDTPYSRQVLGEAFVAQRLSWLQELHEKAQELISLKHLEPEATGFIAKMTGKSSLGFPTNATNLAIAHAMQQLHDEETRRQLR